ncbi:hypothetical protein CwatDRAFT_1462 [Crocosphaera watsonii WH 8501]|uniref:Uncharacterized protein n=1 Tax=Crocosphaera watsonii WH 8501 TaxID=165597 RepID=Q4BWS4_CROWT|nr:hypothetical protein CwatDRAFT_1462 [Crocosphaera watsonii WH 8501]
MLEQGIHLITTDEMTGIQALERLFPNKRIKPKQVEKIEFEYERHGTLSLIANWDVARGKVISPSIGPTRTEQPRFRTSKCSIKKYIVLKSPKIIPGEEYFSFH